ncbi:hypothetical protein ISF_07326 [Cordyceps fumosorosea ARSEF 2679]|uniref:Uncharacterized protein n=1 Tax=Cordyceps fumosorosea (strain ARSEF 2679) TaxID=1081104 RepID=A0A167PM82_CORFA|nr:hypothetical protein ISF_07326 [Cordyceps fumosorosea ARSEF 2679]OAA56810.1 hypothetical protein ISF_07326 [Cordyceps fumosorosea ARSEF 2679]
MIELQPAKTMCCWNSLQVGADGRTGVLHLTWPESLAATGSNLHNQSTIGIQNASEAIRRKIDELKRESTAALTTSTKLYQIMSQPLAERAEQGRDEEEDTVNDHLILLHEESANADEKVESLHEQWQACVRTEQEAWKRLTDDHDAPQQEPELHNLIDAIEEIVRNGEREINTIEEEYAEYIQIESLKVMQTLMEG